jgi:hypothetical protein
MSKPIQTLREGNVNAAIFENESVKGKFRTATIQLRYKDKDGEWKTGNSFGAKDLENLEKIAKAVRPLLAKNAAPIDSLDA